MGDTSGRRILLIVTGGNFHYGPDDFSTSKTYPAGYCRCMVGYNFRRDTFVHDTGTNGLSAKVIGIVCLNVVHKGSIAVDGTSVHDHRHLKIQLQYVCLAKLYRKHKNCVT